MKPAQALKLMFAALAFIAVAAIGFAWSVFVKRGMRVLLDVGDIVFVFAGVATAGVPLLLPDYLKRAPDAHGPNT